MPCNCGSKAKQQQKAAQAQSSRAAVNKIREQQAKAQARKNADK